MTKITLTNLVNLQNETTAVNAINANNSTLTTALDNTLSRDGTSPNQMNAVLDMNNNQILNLPAPSTVNSPARLIDVTTNPTIVIPGTGTSGHTVPFLDGSNTWSGTNAYSLATTFNAPIAFNSTATFSTPPVGLVSSVSTGAGISGGPITSSGTITLDVNSLTLKAAPDQYADTLPIYDATAVGIKKIRVRPPRGHVWGLTLSNDATTPNTVIDISAGEAASDATSPLMMVSPAFTKSCNSIWSAGTNNGALDTGGFIPSTGYHVYQIMRSDTGNVDFLISASATAPIMPANYDHKRRIGWIRTDGSTHILPFKQQEDSFWWGTAVVDVNGVPAALSDISLVLTVPAGIRVIPLISVAHSCATSNSGVYIRSPDLQPSSLSILSTSSGDGGSNWLLANGTTATRGTVGPNQIYTNTSGQIVYSTIGTGTTLIIRTMGWTDTRGRLS